MVKPSKLTVPEYSDLHDFAMIVNPDEVDAAYEALSPRLQKLWDDYSNAKVSDFLADFYISR